MRKIFIVILTLLSQQLSFCQWRPWAWQCQFTMLLLLQSWHWQTPHFIPLSFFNAIVVSTLTRLLAGTPQPQAWKKHILTSPTMADSCFNKLMIHKGQTGGLEELHELCAISSHNEKETHAQATRKERKEVKQNQKELAFWFQTVHHVSVCMQQNGDKGARSKHRLNVASENPINGKTLHKGPVAHAVVI